MTARGTARDTAGERVKHVVLIGLPGVGKSSLGRLLAEVLGRDFVDLDTEIQRSEGRSVTEIFEKDGEPAFRAAECAASLALVNRAPVVVAPGGGWVINSSAVAHLRSTSRIIYLRVAPREALRRIGRGLGRRPLLAGDPRAKMEILYTARRSEYERCADMTVETTGVSRPDVLVRLVELVRAAERDFERE